jgi:AraC-like DNA-binding protein
MCSQVPKITIKAWESEGLLLERYTYTSGSVEPLPKHSHHEYQFGLSFDCLGEYYYRGALHQIPMGNLSIIHSGEVHSPSERTYLPAPAKFWMMHINPDFLKTAVLEITEKQRDLPFFDTAFLADKKLSDLFIDLHFAVEKQSSKLEQDSILLLLLTHSITRYAQNSPMMRPYKSVHPAIMRVRDYLEAYYTQNVSLDELALVAGLSRFHLCRAFRKEIGVTPHFYQMQVRIAHAKRLLAHQTAITDVASKMGFYDQSHFGWHFKRLVGVTPGNYLGNK